MKNFTVDNKYHGEQIIVTTLGKLANNLKGRSNKLDISQLKCFVIDECDVFFSESKNLSQLKEVYTKYIKTLPHKVQNIIFSATYSDDVKKTIGEFSADANQIELSKESLALDHIAQFEMRLEKGKKPDFIKEVFSTCEMTQTVIFVNTRKFAEILHNMMRKANLKSTIIFGDMHPEERDEYIAKFRTGEVSVVITTNMLARGIDVPETQIVINYDVPTTGERGQERVGDSENYMHRIGRTGRFGVRGIAVTIYDRDEDKTYLDQILDYYSMKNKCSTLEGPEQLKSLLEEIRAEQV